jgi:hypothetical protein
MEEELRLPAERLRGGCGRGWWEEYSYPEEGIVADRLLIASLFGRSVLRVYSI